MGERVENSYKLGETGARDIERRSGYADIGQAGINRRAYKMGARESGKRSGIDARINSKNGCAAFCARGGGRPVGRAEYGDLVGLD